MAMIEQIKFSLMSPTLVKKFGAINVTKSEVYDADAYPIDDGVMDPHMGVIDPGMRCRTCGGKSGECLGHFGYIELAKPVLNILYVKKIKDILVLTCHDCGALLTDATKPIPASKISKTTAAKKCPKCGIEQEPIKFERPLSFRRGRMNLNAEEIRAHLEQVSAKDARILGLKGGKPEWMVITLLLVPSITTRPSITLMNGERSEDDLTHKLVDIIRINQRLANNLEIGAPDFILEDLWELLQYHVSTLFNNEISGIPPARHRSGRQLKTLSQRLKAKEGRFRNNLTGKRVNFSARTVVSPDPNISLNEVGVPKRIARELTVPITVTKDNLREIKKRIALGPNVHGGINYVLRPDGLRKRITEENKAFIKDELDVGFMVERHIDDGDIVLFNRQPSLHRMSIMAHRVRVMPGKTFRLNLCVCRPYNADFDGDEMNMHVPQTAEARVEAENLMLVQENIRSPGYGKSIIGCAQDYISGGYVLTRDGTTFGKEEVAQMLANLDIFEKLDKKEYTGKELFSFIIPKEITIGYKAKVCRNCEKCTKDSCPNDAYVVVKDGELKKGVIDKNSIASESGKLLDAIDLECGHDASRLFLERVTRLTEECLMRKGFTISVSDEDIPSGVKGQISKIINEHTKKIDEHIKEFSRGKTKELPGRTKEQTLEELVMREAYDITSRSQDAIDGGVAENSAVIMARTGARGSMQNMTFIAGLVGQESVRGMRIFRGYKDRTLPHFKPKELSLEAHGFVTSSYKTGLKPTEFFFEAMKGREGLMDSSLKTRISGYMQRRLVNAVQDVKVTHDWRVRDAGGTIVQFVPGEDGIDPAKSDGGVLVNVR